MYSPLVIVSWLYGIVHYYNVRVAILLSFHAIFPKRYGLTFLDDGVIANSRIKIRPHLPSAEILYNLMLFLACLDISITCSSGFQLNESKPLNANWILQESYSVRILF